MTSIQMPQLGETIIEGTILKWLKAEGDAVKADEPLFEISTDKVDTEVPSPVAGTVTKILVAEGATVPVGTAVMEIDDGSAGAGGNGSLRRPPRSPVAARRPRRLRRRRPPPLHRLPRPRRRQLPPDARARRSPRCPTAGRGRRSCPRSCGGWPRSVASIWRTVAGTGEGGRITEGRRVGGVARGTGRRRRDGHADAVRAARRPRPWW